MITWVKVCNCFAQSLFLYLHIYFNAEVLHPVHIDVGTRTYAQRQASLGNANFN